MKRRNQKTTLEFLQKTASYAVSSIRSTIESLSAINDTIDVEHESNNCKIAELQSTNVALDNLKNENSRIISNFERLLK